MTHQCEQCAKEMNIVDYLIGKVCHACCVKNHKKALGR